MKWLLCLLICLCTRYPAAFCLGDDQFFLQHLDNRNGLSNSAVNHIFQDSDHLLWIGTWDGLNMFDGSSFHVFNYGNRNGLRSIENNVIQSITQDNRKNLWISTVEGISRYEKGTGLFYNYFYNHSRKGRVSEQEYKLAVDSKGNTFCWTLPYGLTFYETKADSFRTIPFSPGKADINKMLFDENDRLWVLGDDGRITVYNKNGLNFKPLHTYHSTDSIVSIFNINHRIFFSNAGGSLYETNPQTLQEKEVLKLPYAAKAMILYKGHYLMASGTKGYRVFDSAFQPSTFLGEEVDRMQEMRITSFTLATEQILWCGTDGNGVIKIYPRTKSFETVYTSGNGMLSNKSVRAFCQENDNLWIGTKGNGIIRFPNFRSDRPEADRKPIQVPASALDNNAVFVLKKGFDNILYIGTDGKGIGLYDLKNSRFFKWQDINGNAQCKNFGSVYAIQQDNDSTIWLGTSGYGLIHLKIFRNKAGIISVNWLSQYVFKDNDLGPANDIIYALAAGDDDHLWVACRYGGLSLMNKRTHRFKTFKAFTYEGSLSHNDVLSLYKDRKNNIWIGTSYGLNRLSPTDMDKSQPVFRKLTTTNGLPNNTIHAITEDSAGQIWVSTNKGLAKIQPASMEISHYQEADGLQSNEFSDGAVWTDASGRIFFGGTYGFSFFLPRNIRENTLSPNLLVSGVQLGGKTINDNWFMVLQSKNDHPPAYTINRKGDFFELQIKAMSFLNAEKCEYAYYLEGADKIWHYSGTSGKIIYNNILPGRYALKVKWSNGEGIWTKETTMFSLTVKQYFWLTWPALLIYALILCIAGYILYTYRRNKFAMKHQLEIEHAMRKKEEELHQEQLGFFTNITHELQTPLTMIMGSIEHYIEKSPEQSPKRNYFLSIVHQQASRLTYLVQQLLDFRRAEAGFLKDHPVITDISALLTNLSNLFIPLCEQQQKKYTCFVAENVTRWIDKDKLEKVMFNLISNAVKHSGKNEQIVLMAAANEDTGTLEISVANSGSSVTAGELERLFDKFYMAGIAGNEKFGAGIGLAFTRQLILLMKGTIEAAVENGWIRFVVKLPVSKVQEFEDEEIVSTVSATRPSYLFHAMTSVNKTHPVKSALANNKLTLVESLDEEKTASILLVEDEISIRYLLRDILKDQYNIYEAENGREALELLQTLTPDIIISDIMMPDMNGLELCNIIKNAPATCHIPFILLSARGSIEHQTEGYEVGADAYIPKPFHINNLKVRVRKLLEYRKRLIELFKSDALIDYQLEPELAETDKKFLAAAVEIIEKHLDETEFNAAQLEKEMNISRMQLYRKLKTLSQMTPAEFIKHIRLKHAAHLLSSTQLTVSEVFYRTGFNNQSYFFREFKKQYQCAPGEYRN